VRGAVARTGAGPWPQLRFSVQLRFRTPAPTMTSEVWDLDNLIKPTLDAMEGVFGLRRWQGIPQPADDRVDHIDAMKRTVRLGELPGVEVEVWATSTID
jgi:Holliday junction resolvase RusA-like endonuclease